MNPVDDALAELEKSAFFGAFRAGAARALGGAGEHVAEGALQGLGGLAVAGVAAGAVAGIKRLQDAAAKSREFKQMLGVDPELAELQSEQPEMFNMQYNSLRRLNPTYGRDPIVAASYMRKMMESPAGAGTLLAASMRPPEAPRDRGIGMSVSQQIGPMRFERSF